MLLGRAAAIGFKINKVVYRGYTASGPLQELHDMAIRTRTELRLAQEAEEQRQKQKDFELGKSTERFMTEREEEAARQAHRLDMEAAEHKQRLKMEEEKHAAQMAQRRTAAQLEMEEVAARNAKKLEYYGKLAEMGVDVTRVLVAAEGKAPNQVLKLVEADAGFTGRAGGAGIHVHA